ncbi:nucleotide exchange factor GrpE [Candidatus Roizmanbacteria bacterium CG03_land_8_20_14_0_80_35_26]|uniref:Protein GrpE n=2 Tax=Candidatus Roizmaniibacteriota TaxID=1752723 RepID=A0A2M7BX77_9BACT|nr:MAG: nucleotide exchange factor GrpE [Candidatus Roizmanbacteria bacterium CG03_land_8_20_14_0_80_35_26]PJC80544.1 MAG: nucleotide exchange factor GrpE [Candidatus Roizmanbacteria bacterium CG_4_8_14_3_um_filter_36_12]
MKKVTKNLEIEKLKKEVEEYKNKYLRALADYQNFEKRVKEERNQLVRTANLNLIMKLLPFLDSLEKAEVFIKDQGLKIAKDHLFQSLKEIGIEEIDVVNKPFNPKVAEAIDIVQGDKDDVVVEVLRKGYRIEDKILRVAQVKVSKKVTS